MRTTAIGTEVEIEIAPGFHFFHNLDTPCRVSGRYGLCLSTLTLGMAALTREHAIRWRSTPAVSHPYVRASTLSRVVIGEVLPTDRIRVVVQPWEAHSRATGTIRGLALKSVEAVR